MTAESTLRRVLDDLERRIDPQRAHRVVERHRAALNYEPLDTPPLVLYLPYEGDRFRPYPYAEAFDDPAKMMVNELLVGFSSIYHAIDFDCDTPYCIRPNFASCPVEIEQFAPI